MKTFSKCAQYRYHSAGCQKNVNWTLRTNQLVWQSLSGSREAKKIA